MQKPKIIYSLSEFYRHKLGWTYVLLSKDKRYLKVGKTTADLELRIKSINYDYNYQGYDFSLLIACVDARHESRFHHFFRDYRACFRWYEPGNEHRNLTYEQAWSLAVKKSRKSCGIYRKDNVRSVFCQYHRKTIVELFKIPPKKLSPNLISIIEDEIHQIWREKGTRKSRYLTRTAPRV